MEKKEVIEVIDFEINRIFSQQKIPGWSRWAILGALITVLGLFFNALKAEEFSLQVVFDFILGFNLIAIGLSSLISMACPPECRGNNFDRYQIGFFSDRRPVLLWGFLQISAMIWLVFSGTETFAHQRKIALWLFFTLEFVLLTGLVLSFLRYPFPISQENKSPRMSTTIMVIFALAGLYCGIGFWQNVYRMDALLHIESIKLSGLVICIGYLLGLLIKGDPSAPLLETLINIRRNVMFNTASPEVGLKEVEIVVLGMSVSDVSQGYVKEMLLIFDELNNANIKNQQNLKCVQELIQKSELENIQPIKAIWEDYETNNKLINEKQEKLKRKLDSFKKRITWVYLISSKKVGDGVSNILSEVKKQAESFQQTKNKNDEIAQDIKKICNQHPNLKLIVKP